MSYSPLDPSGLGEEDSPRPFSFTDSGRGWHPYDGEFDSRKSWTVSSSMSIFLVHGTKSCGYTSAYVLIASHRIIYFVVSNLITLRAKE